MQRKIINFKNRIKNAKQKICSICINLYRIYESNDYDKVFETLSRLKNKKIKVNNILIEKYRDKLKNPDFEQDYWSKTATGKLKHDGIRLIK